MSIYNFEKILAHQDVSKLNSKGFRKLFHVRIEPTELCNFQCKFCATQDPERLGILRAQGFDGNNRKFDLNRLLNLLDELKNVGVKAISFTASGEPLMFPVIQKVIEKAIELEFDLALTSNFGMPIKDNLIKLLSSFSWLRWSMNGDLKKLT